MLFGNYNIYKTKDCAKIQLIELIDLNKFIRNHLGSYRNAPKKHIVN